MRVLIITPLYPPAVGGAATYFSDVVPRLARQEGVKEVIVLTERMPGQPQQRVEGRVRLLRYLPTRVSGPQRGLVSHTLTYALTQCWFAARLPALVQHYRVELVHMHTRYRGRAVYSALRRCAVPVVADLRDRMTDVARLVGVADWLLCCGEGVRGFAVQGGFPAERTVLIPIPFTPPTPSSPSQVAAVRERYRVGLGPYLLYVGDITPAKGVYELLTAYRRWRTRHPEVGLVLAGINREGARFLSQVSRTPGARYLGHISHPDALCLMQGARVVLLPSRSEGLPRVVLEAVALGTPVICPPGIPEFSRHLPRFVLPTVTPEAILVTLEDIWHIPETPTYPLEEHDVGRVVAQLLETYRQALLG